MVEKAVSGAALTPAECLLREVWLLDAERQNGGLSQYFCNWGRKRWDGVSRLARVSLPAFASFAGAVEDVVRASADPYGSVLAAERTLNALCDRARGTLIAQLRAPRHRFRVN